jgi:hypothetical protein
MARRDDGTTCLAAVASMLRCTVDPRGPSDEALGVMVALEADPNWLLPALLQVAMDATDDAPRIQR